MIFDMLVLFIIIIFIAMILSIYTMEDDPMLAIPFIMVGMVFCILVTYGLWDVQFPYVAYNATVGNASLYYSSTDVYGDPYSYVFVLLFMIHMVLFFKCGFNMWRDALQTKAELEYTKRK